jgi:hypothetical protein
VHPDAEELKQLVLYWVKENERGVSLHLEGKIHRVCRDLMRHLDKFDRETKLRLKELAMNGLLMIISEEDYSDPLEYLRRQFKVVFREAFQAQFDLNEGSSVLGMAM